LQSATDMNALEFEVPRDRFIQLDEAGDGAVSFEVFGGRGQRIPAAGADGRRRMRARVRDGRSAVVRVTEDARQLVIYDGTGAVQNVLALAGAERGVEHLSPDAADATTSGGPR
jgi:hypothetical protein